MPGEADDFLIFLPVSECLARFVKSIKSAAAVDVSGEGGLGGGRPGRASCGVAVAGKDDIVVGKIWVPRCPLRAGDVLWHEGDVHLERAVAGKNGPEILDPALPVVIAGTVNDEDLSQGGAANF